MNDSDLIRLDLPASLQHLEVVGACAAAMLAGVDDLADPEDTLARVQLAVHEVCLNIVQHAYAGQIPGRILLSFHLAADPRRLIVEVQDTGCAFDAATVPAPDLDQGQERGYGLFLMRALLDEAAYYAEPAGNRWSLVKNL